MKPGHHARAPARRAHAAAIGACTLLLTACGAGGGDSLDSGTNDVDGPTPGMVADGGPIDLATQASTRELSAHWQGFQDASAIVGYEWALGVTPGGTEVQGWTQVGDTTSASNGALALNPGSRYYAAVRATDALGNVGVPAVSNGVLIDGGSSGGGSGTSAPAMASSISRQGFTWTFDGPHLVGQFVNGDWWVVGPVDIVSISPRSQNNAGRVMHGSMVNPDPSVRDQAYDSTMYAGNAASFFRSGQNVALGVDAAHPLTLAGGSSLVSTESLSAPGVTPQLKRAAVLTVVSSQPPADAFRPPYSGTAKPIWREGDLDVSKLATLAPQGAAPSFATAADWFDRVWLDHAHGWLGRYLHPEENMPDYGREMSDRVGNAALLLHTDAPLSQKRNLLVRFVQLGIDLYGIAENGGRWPSDGGHSSGRKFPILFAGELLDDPQFLAATRRAHVRFGEDGQTFYVAETSPGIINFGHGGYTAQDVNLPEWGFQHDSNPSRDRRSWTADNYRVCCTANCWLGWVLAARIMNLRSQWDHEALFDYQDRFMGIETPGTWTRSWSPFAESMWDHYRAQF